MGKVGVEAESQRALLDEITVSLRLLSMLRVSETADSNSTLRREARVVESVEGVKDSEDSKDKDKPVKRPKLVAEAVRVTVSK